MVNGIVPSSNGSSEHGDESRDRHGAGQRAKPHPAAGHKRRTTDGEDTPFANTKLEMAWITTEGDKPCAIVAAEQQHL